MTNEQPSGLAYAGMSWAASPGCIQAVFIAQPVAVVTEQQGAGLGSGHAGRSKMQMFVLLWLKQP